MVLRAAQGLYAFAMTGAGFVNDVGDRCGADKAERLNIRMHHQGIHRLFVTLHHVKHAVGQARFAQQLCHQQTGAGVEGAGLQDKRVATGNGHGIHPHRDHHGEVKRRYTRHHAQALTHGPVINAG